MDHVMETVTLKSSTICWSYSVLGQLPQYERMDANGIEHVSRVLCADSGAPGSRASPSPCPVMGPG
jgi:hypothetical protein